MRAYTGVTNGKGIPKDNNTKRLGVVKEKALFNCQEDDLHSIIKCLDDIIFEQSPSKEEYLDQSTLARRLYAIILHLNQDFCTKKSPSHPSGFMNTNASQSRHYVSEHIDVSTDFIQPVNSYSRFNSYSTPEPYLPCSISSAPRQTSQQDYQQPPIYSNTCEKATNHAGNVSKLKRKWKHGESNFLTQYSHTVECSRQQKMCSDIHCRKMRLFIEHMKTCHGNCKLECNRYKVILEKCNKIYTTSEIFDSASETLSEYQLCNSAIERSNACTQMPVNDAEFSFIGSYYLSNDKTASSKHLKKSPHSLSPCSQLSPGKDSKVLQPIESVSDSLLKCFPREHFNINKSSVHTIDNIQREKNLSITASSIDVTEKDKNDVQLQSAIPLVSSGQCLEEKLQLHSEVHKTIDEVQSNMEPSENASKTNFVGVLDVEHSSVQSAIPYSGQGFPQIMHVQKENGIIEMKVKDSIATLSQDIACETVSTKDNKVKSTGLSYIEWFTCDQVKVHLENIKQTIDQGEGSAKKLQFTGPFDENTCQLCGWSNLNFEPPAIFCSVCCQRIGRSTTYYTMPVNDAFVDSCSIETYFCNKCYKNKLLKCDGVATPKKRLERKRNDECDSEPWVQCDKCAAWQHQICGLFNHIKNERDKAEYTCPNCYMKNLNSGDCVPLSEKILLGAENLPKSKLSKHIEKRLIRCLEEEQKERARKEGKHLDEVLGVEGLIVRVVSSIDKTLEVKKMFHTTFEKENYPKVFPYKSKAILLFQKNKGADVCIFAMYVQEYGSECPPPNQRHVYISYLDSVKYFSPEVQTVTGEALRTFVYHELLIGYLDYCKIRGFTCCYIWSCPSMKRDDFILNCHPEKQKMPKHDKLREWYRVMLQKASKENIVVHTTNLHDYFFVSDSECKMKISAARLPSFDGDYWSCQAEEILNDIKREEEGIEPKKISKMSITRRDLKAFGHGTSMGTSKDILLMHKLREVIQTRKEDFILVQLQHICNHCCQPILTGKRWDCSFCQRFFLCDRCYKVEKQLDLKYRHPVNVKEKHSFSLVDVAATPSSTNDNDITVKSEVFDNRMNFLNFCQQGHYQFDTLRRAKHSTMMILYQHHSTTTPVSTNAPSICNSNVKDDQNLQCDKADIPQIKSSRTKLLELMKHSAECPTASCGYLGCQDLKFLFRHSAKCRVRYNQGCLSCRKVWHLIHLHSRNCDKFDCRVPRCFDMRKHVKRLKEKKREQAGRRHGFIR